MTESRPRVHARSPYLDDFQVGTVYVSRARTVTEAHLVLFTGLAGMQTPFFIDHEYARQSTPFGSPIVPGFLTASFSGGMLESVLGGNVVAGLGMSDFEFRVPVRPGDTLHTEVTILDIQPGKRPDRGSLSAQIDVFNQKEEIVLAYQATVMMKRSNGEGDKKE